MAASFQISGPGSIRELRVQSTPLGSEDGVSLIPKDGFAGVSHEVLKQRESEAFERGKVEGRSEALAQAEVAEQDRRLAEEARQHDRFRSLFEALSTQLGEVHRRQEELLLELVSQALTKLAGTLPARGDLALSVSRECLAAVRASKVGTLILHPDDHAELLAVGRDLGGDPLGALGVPIRTCPSVGRGGCRLETEFGTLDGSMAARLEVLQEVLCP